MYQCWIENSYGEKLELTNNKDYTVYRIDGLEPPTATINTSTVANIDGSRFNSARMSERNIVIYLTIEGDCEKNRIALYRYVKSKRAIRFYFKNESRNVFTDGYVEKMEIGFFDAKQAVQISILCPYPYLKNVSSTITKFFTTTPKFVFPFAYEESGEPFSSLELTEIKSLVNEGDVDVGAIISIHATARALNPVIYDHSSGEYFKLAIDMLEGDEVTISTIAGQKSVTLLHDGQITNIINKMYIGSSWLRLVSGDNLFSYGADEYPENIQCTVTYTAEYEGV